MDELVYLRNDEAVCVIDSGIIAGKHYKEIYQDCKKRLETVKDLAYLEQSA